MKARFDELNKTMDESIASRKELGEKYANKFQELIAQHRDVITDIIGRLGFHEDVNDIYARLRAAEKSISKNFIGFDKWKKMREDDYAVSMTNFKKEEDEKRYGNMSFYDSQPGIPPVKPDWSEQAYNKAKEEFEDAKAGLSEMLDANKVELSEVYKKLKSLIAIDSDYQSVNDVIDRLGSKMSGIKEEFDDQVFDQLKNICSNKSFWQDKSSGLTSMFKGLPDTIDKVNGILSNNKLPARQKYSELNRLYIGKANDGKEVKRVPDLVEFQKILGKLGKMRENLDLSELEKFSSKINGNKSAKQALVDTQRLNENADPNKPKTR